MKRYKYLIMCTFLITLWRFRVFLARFGAVCAGLVLVATATVPAGFAHDLRHGDIHIGHSWARPAAQGATAEVYFAIINRGRHPDRLVGAKTPVAARASIAETDGDAVNILSGLDLPAGRPVALRPGRFHIRLEGLGRNLAVGDRFPLTLVFATASPAEIEVIVETGPGH